MIAVDWGTSSLRAYRLDASGTIVVRRRAEFGVMACRDRFGAALAAQIDGWDDPDIVLCGMIGSRQGWVEVPYVECAAGAVELAAGMTCIEAPEFDGRRLWFVPGMADRGSDVADVMRGEETQIVALLDAFGDGTHLVCLPGTHSKWVVVRDRAIASIATAMTGELYAVLRAHSTLGRLMGDGESRFDAPAFDEGLRRSAEPGGLLHHLFGVRTAGLFDRLPAAALPSYLSGLLIGHEVRSSRIDARTPPPEQVHLIGSEHLLEAYARALGALGIGVRRHPEHLAATGMHRLARLRGIA